MVMRILLDAYNTLRLHDGFQYSLLKAPAVSAATNYAWLCLYTALCICEGKQTELARRQHYHQDNSHFRRQKVIEYPETALPDGRS